VKTRLLTLVAVLFVLALSAQAQSLCCFASWGVPLDEKIGLLQSTPPWGFTAYAVPTPPYYVYFNITRQWAWISTCPQGGIAFVDITTSPPQTDPPPQYLSQINVSSVITNPITLSIQGQLAGFAAILLSGSPPVWVYTINTGGPCGFPYGNRYQSGQ
jgi:hypothetical protein